MVTWILQIQVTIMPKILEQSIVAQSKLFRIEEVKLEFDNGVIATHERLIGAPYGAVLVIPIDSESLYLIREYATGLDRYELGLPKGRIEIDEDPLYSANRELQEEIGFASNKLSHIRTISLAPAYSNQQTYVVLAQDLTPQTAQGDEPEPLEVIKWPLAKLDQLLDHSELTEARSIAAIYMLKQIGY